MPLLSRFRNVTQKSINKNKNKIENINTTTTSNNNNNSNISGKRKGSASSSSNKTVAGTTAGGQKSTATVVNPSSCCADRDCCTTVGNKNNNNNNTSNGSGTYAKQKSRNEKKKSSNLQAGNTFRVYLNPSVKRKITNAFVMPILSRSNTFTLNEEPSRYDSDCGPGAFDYNRRNIPKKTNVRTDVFETFYSQRPSKSSRSSKSSFSDHSPSITYNNNHVDDLYRQQTMVQSGSASTNPQFDGNTYRKSRSTVTPNMNTKQSMVSTRTVKEQANKPREYIFGSMEKGSGSSKKQPIEMDDDSNKFNTVTLRSFRRSFRDSFLEKVKPKAGKEHLPLWFIDVKDEIKPLKDVHSSRSPSSIRDEHDYDDEDDEVFNRPPSSSPSQKSPDKKSNIIRNETFRIDGGKPDKYSNQRKVNGINRNDTFRIDSSIETLVDYDNSNDAMNRSSAPAQLQQQQQQRHRGPYIIDRNRKNLEPIRVEIKREKINRPGKIVPVAITAPYSASNDSDLNNEHRDDDTGDNDEKVSGINSGKKHTISKTNVNFLRSKLENLNSNNNHGPPVTTPLSNRKQTVHVQYYFGDPVYPQNNNTSNNLKRKSRESSPVNIIHTYNKNIVSPSPSPTPVVVAKRNIVAAPPPIAAPRRQFVKQDDLDETTEYYKPVRLADVRKPNESPWRVRQNHEWIFDRMH